MGSSISPPKKNKDLPFDEQATLGFPTSYSYTDIDNDPTFESLEYGRTDSPLSNNNHSYHHHHHHHKSCYNSTISTGYSNDSRINDISFYSRSIPIPRRKYFDIEKNYKDELKRTSKKYPIFTFKNDSIIDIIDSETSKIYMDKNKKFHRPDENVISKFKKGTQYPLDDDDSSNYYIESSHSHSIYDETVQDITESLSILSTSYNYIIKNNNYNNKNNIKNNSYNKNTNKNNNSNNKTKDNNIININKYSLQQNKSTKENNHQKKKDKKNNNSNNNNNLYSKNVIIHRKGMALPEIKMEKSPSFIPPNTYGNMYDFNEISTDMLNVKHEFSIFNKNPNNNYFNKMKDNYNSSSNYQLIHKNNNNNNNNNYTNSNIISTYSKKKNHKVTFQDLSNSSTDYSSSIITSSISYNNRKNNEYPYNISGNPSKGTFMNNLKTKHHEKSDLSKEISKIQKKNRNEEEIIYIDNIRYNNMFKS